MSMKLGDLFSHEAIVLDFPPSEKEDLLESVVRHLDSNNLVKKYEQTLQHVIEREKVMSTGIGHGVAIPHAYTDGVDRLVAGFFRTSEGVDFSALDGKPVDLIFIILGPKDSRRDHIKVLAKISRLLNHASFRSGLRKASNADEVFDVFKRFGDR